MIPYICMWAWMYVLKHKSFYSMILLFDNDYTHINDEKTICMCLLRVYFLIAFFYVLYALPETTK